MLVIFGVIFQFCKIEAGTHLPYQLLINFTALFYKSSIVNPELFLDLDPMLFVSDLVTKSRSWFRNK